MPVKQMQQPKHNYFRSNVASSSLTMADAIQLETKGGRYFKFNVAAAPATFGSYTSSEQVTCRSLAKQIV